MKTTVVVVDMVKDNLEHSPHAELTAYCRSIVVQVNTLTAAARKRSWPVIFATYSFLPGDAIFCTRDRRRRG